jgi:hypothetical protein
MPQTFVAGPRWSLSEPAAQKQQIGIDLFYRRSMLILVMIKQASAPNTQRPRVLTLLPAF